MIRRAMRGVSLLAIVIVPVSSAKAFNPVAVTVADFNGDGYDDVAVLNDDDASVFLIRSNGDRTFEPFTPSTLVTGAPHGLAITSGVLGTSSAVSLAVASGDSVTFGAVSVLLGNGDGTFKTARSNTVGVSPDALVVARLNGDAWNDLAVVDSEEFADQNISLLYGNSDGTFQADQRTTAEISSIGIAAADFDQDGKMDLVDLRVGSRFFREVTLGI